MTTKTPIRIPVRREESFCQLCFVGEIPLKQLDDHVAGKQGCADWNAGSTMKALNILISKAIRGDGSLLAQYTKAGIAQVSANKFFLGSEYHSLATSLCAVRGLYYTAKPGVGKLLLNINSATSAFFETVTVAEFLKDTTTFARTFRTQLQDKGCRAFKLSFAALSSSHFILRFSPAAFYNTVRFLERAENISPPQRDFFRPGNVGNILQSRSMSDAAFSRKSPGNIIAIITISTSHFQTTSS